MRSAKRPVRALPCIPKETVFRFQPRARHRSVTTVPCTNLVAPADRTASDRLPGPAIGYLVPAREAAAVDPALEIDTPQYEPDDARRSKQQGQVIACASVDPGDDLRRESG